MARSVNKVQLIGYVGGEPSTHDTVNGSTITSFSLATGESWTDRNTGQRQERTEWHRVACFGKIAEIIARYAKKGSRMYIEGKNRTREWTDDQGVKRYTTEVVVDLSGQAIVLDPRGDSNEGADARAQNQYDAYMQSAPQAQASAGDSNGNNHNTQETAPEKNDIPF